MLSHLFNGFGNLFSAFSHITKVTDIMAEEMELTTQLESGSTVRQLTKQLAMLEAT